MARMNTNKMKKTTLITILFTGFIAAIFLTEQYLESNFLNNGEAYMKGAGHLPSENFSKALLFLIARHLLISTILSLFFFISFGMEKRRQLFKWLTYSGLAVFTILALYSVYQINNIIANGYDGTNRIIEITVIWLCRLLGLFIGYLIAVNLPKEKALGQKIW